MAGNGKGKGSSWERDIARFLTKWMSGQDKELYCWRSPGSGSVATINLGNKAISGDLIPLKNESTKFFDIFSVECKNGYPGADPFKCIMKTKGDDIKDFWTQANRDAAKAEKLPMLIFKKKGVRGNPFVGVTEEAIIKYFPKGKTLSYLVFKFSDIALPRLYMLDLNDFFSTISYEDFNVIDKEIK